MEQKNQVCFKGSFSFRNDSIRQTRIEDGIFFRLESLGPAIAKAYFVDDSSAEVPIPRGFLVNDVTNHVVINPVPVLQFFVLSWSDAYDITYEGHTVLDARTQRQWALAGDTDRAVETICP